MSKMKRLWEISSQFNCLPRKNMWQSLQNRFESCRNKIADEAEESRNQSGSSRYSKNAGKQWRGPWYLASGFLLFWVLIFFAIVVPLFYRLPNGLTIEDAHKGVFIAQRAQKDLWNLDKIGPKVVGSDANENQTVGYLLSVVEEILDNALDDYFDIEVDLQEVSGSYIHRTMINMYQGVQNIAIRLTPKNSTSNTTILINGHFDSKPTSPSAGDDGQMVVVILEVLRVMSSTRQTFRHPIIFLLNGAEENPLEASHGFITQHPWAKDCKVLINLDSSGGGGREILFQSGPNHPWLVKYYKDNAKHYFATTMAEEIFQTGILPSDTDFHIFVTHGNLIGLDIAQCINGYTYHTKYDRFSNIPRGSTQNTGENVLALVRALVNATELNDLSAHASGHAVFFDFLGISFISYNESTGVILNCCVALITLILIFISIWRIASVNYMSTGYVAKRFFLILVLQIVAVVLGFGFPLIVAYVLDKYGLPMTYFSTPLLMIGLYVCPSLLGLSLPSYIYLRLQKTDKISYAQQIQLVLHGHAAVLVLLTVAMTSCDLRSTYVVTWTLIFYVIPLILNLLTTLHDRAFAWAGLHKIFQIIPFAYNSYLIFCFLVILTPMMGRFGRSINPDLIISALNSLGTIMALGFLIPLINMFRRPGLILIAILAVSGVTIYTATSTLIGFPYRPVTNVQRVPFLHVRRTFYEYDGSVSKDDSGYLFNFQDRRGPNPLKNTEMNMTGLVYVASDCDKYLMCGYPMYDHRWVKNRLNALYLPRSEPVVVPYDVKLELLNRTILENNVTVRFEFRANCTDHCSVFIQHNKDVNISKWSFEHTYIGTQATYHIYFTYGKDNSPLTFFIEFSKSNGDFNVPIFHIGLAVHFIGKPVDETSQKFIDSLPSYAAPVDWPTSYQVYNY
ncbi:putative endoplasmic reticulum metallopeptidase 1-A [Drosophila bipectinata]|uniref:putative endoplasmic reticulum metallopeptidase 1-A n=1 Tax=Drosophila bipectinata TaxID=42026 RepID=UPI0038B3C3AA